MRRIALIVALVAVVGCALAAPAAFAQGDAFGPLPPAAPEPTPVPTQTGLDDQDDVSRGALFAIAGGVLLVFVGIGVAILRDARRNLTEDDRRRLDRGRSGLPATEPGMRRKPPATAKTRARKKGKAQRQARKAGRRR